MIPHKNQPKQQRYYGWLDTPLDERQPKSELQLASQLHVSPQTLNTWKKKRAEYDFLPVRELSNRLGEKLDLTIADIEELIKTGTKEQKIKKAKDVLLYKALKDKDYKACVEYLKSEGAFVVKTEETHKYELTSEDKAEIIRLIGEIQREEAMGESAGNLLPAAPDLLS